MSQTVETGTVTRTVDGVEVPLPGTYALDTAHTRVGFVVRHLMVSKVRGHFDRFHGDIVIGDDPTESSVQVEVDLTSVTTGDAKRDDHLRSPDFFHVDEHPTMSFASTAVRRGKGDRWTVEGDLTIAGVTRPIELEVTFEGAAQSPWGTTSIGFSATGRLNREDFGLNWNQALETGGVLVGKDVTLELEAEAILQ